VSIPSSVLFLGLCCVVFLIETMELHYCYIDNVKPDWKELRGKVL
jgi:hypothetical protein